MHEGKVSTQCWLTLGFSPVYPFADKLNTESEVVSTPPIDWDVLLVRGYEEILICDQLTTLKAEVVNKHKLGVFGFYLVGRLPALIVACVDL
jgi:hypothetical protein